MKDHLQLVCNLMEAIRNLASLESAAEHSTQNQNRRGLVAFGRRPLSCARRQRPAERERKCRAELDALMLAEVIVGANLNPEGPPSVAGTLLPCCVSKGTTISEGPETNTEFCLVLFFPGSEQNPTAAVCLIAVPLETATWADSRFSCPLLRLLFTRRTRAVNPKD